MCILRRHEGHTWSDSSESLVLPPWTTLARPELWSSCGQCLSFWSSCWVPCKSKRVSPGEHRENVEKTSPSKIFLILLTLLVLIYFDYWVIIVIMRNMFLQVFFLSITRVNLNDQQSIICAIQNLFHLSFTWVGHIGTSFFSYLHVGWNKKCLCWIQYLHRRIFLYFTHDVIVSSFGQEMIIVPGPITTCSVPFCTLSSLYTGEGQYFIFNMIQHDFKSQNNNPVLQHFQQHWQLNLFCLSSYFCWVK